MTKHIRAIILAAGRGRRMLPLTNNVPKCLLTYRGKKILEHQLDLIRRNGISQIVVVTGFAADLVRQVGGDNITYVHNEDYLCTNSIYSLFLARQFLDSDVLLMNCDVLAEREILGSLLEEEFPNAVAVDFRGPFTDGEMNVKVSNGYVIEIGKNVPATDACGYSVQYAKFGKEGAETLADEITRLVRTGCIDGFPSDAYGAVIARQGIKAVDVGQRTWFEIDTPENLAEALTLNITCSSAFASEGAENEAT
jgi:choline kinase